MSTINPIAPFGSSSLVVAGSILGGQLMQLLMSDDIVPGSDPSYELCKIIYTYHPLGQKMAETPVNIAQSQEREIIIESAPPEVSDAFCAEFQALHASMLIHDVMRLSRIYGISSVVLLVEGEDANTPLDMAQLWRKTLSFNVLDPLNSAGSLVLSQIPTSQDFNKPVTVRTSGMTFHPTRFEVMMNEQPIYLAYTSSSFGFVGRSVYQRALFPLKSFVRSMVSDDMIATKLGLLVAKQKAPGSVIDNIMGAIAGVKRGLLKQAQTGQVLSIDTDEAIETLNMQNVDGAGSYSRTNIIKNVATSADMPAKLLDNETLVSGFGEGTEDAKNIARYIERIRQEMAPLYRFFDRVTQYRAWNPDFFARMQRLYPTLYAERLYEDVLHEWCDSYTAEWPSLLIEPDSEKVKVEDTKLQATVAITQTLLPTLDPENQSRLIQWAADTISESKRLFPFELDLDYDELEDFKLNPPPPPATEPGAANKTDTEEVGPEAKKFGRFG